MTEEKLSEDLRRFIGAHIDSVEQLEVLLLLRKHPERSWDADSVSRELRSTADSVKMRLQRLHAGGLLLNTPRENGHQALYRFEPATPELVAQVDELAAAYSNRRYTVINTIFEHPIDKIRSFADAFKFRKGD